jgi:hypothetical protein
MPNLTVMAGWGAGVEGVTRELVVDLKPIRVNVVAPGSVHTELYGDMPKEKLEGFLEGIEEGDVDGECRRSGGSGGGLSLRDEGFICYGSGTAK